MNESLKWAFVAFGVEWHVTGWVARSITIWREVGLSEKDFASMDERTSAL